MTSTHYCSSEWPYQGNTTFKHTHKNTYTGFSQIHETVFSESIFTVTYLVRCSSVPQFHFYFPDCFDWQLAASPLIRDGFKVPFKPNPLYVFSATLAKYTDEVFYQRSQWSHSNPKTSSPCHNDWFERLNTQTLLSSGQFQKFKMCLEGMAHTLNSCMCCVRHDSHTQSL